MLGLTECFFSMHALNIRVCACVRVCVLLTWNQSCSGVITISALLPAVSSLTALDGDCKSALFCLQKQSFLHLVGAWLTLTQGEEAVRLCFVLKAS